MNRSEQVNELFSALAKAQGEIKGAVKDSNNPFFKSAYADLESVWSACREPLSKNGLCVLQTPIATETGLALETILGHCSGQWISHTMPVLCTKEDPQGMGSGISYARRYALAAVVGIYQTDDDAEAAMGRKNGNGKGIVTTVSHALTLNPSTPKTVSDPGEFIIQIGKKYKGKKLREISLDELESFLNWLGNQENIDEKGKEFLNVATKYLAMQ